MATIDSTSTEEDISDAYLDNCGYREDNNTAKALAFSTVCMAMAKRAVVRFTKGALDLTFAPGQLNAMAKDAQRFADNAAVPTDGGAGFQAVHFRDFRE